MSLVRTLEASLRAHARALPLARHALARLRRVGYEQRIGRFLREKSGVADRWPDGLVFEAGPGQGLECGPPVAGGLPGDPGSSGNVPWSEALRRALPDDTRLQVHLVGDGIFTRQDARAVLEIFREKGYSCRYLTTSGPAITDERASMLSRLQQQGFLRHLAVTTDGADDGRDARRGGIDALNRTAEGLRRLRDATARIGVHLRVSLNTTLTADRLDELDEMVGVAEASGADTIGLTHLTFTTPDEVDETLRLVGETDPTLIAMPVTSHPGVTGEQVRCAVGAACEQGRRTNVHVGVRPKVAPLLVDSYYTPGAVLAGRCLYPFLHARVSSSGKVHFCPFIRVEVGDLTTSSLEEVWNAPRYVALRKALLEHELFPVCRRCCKVELAPTPAPQPIRVLDHPPRPVTVGALEPAAPAARMSRT